mgnify:FL=1
MSHRPFVKTVPLGGTGATTLTNHGILLGQGTSAIVATSAGTAGQALVSNGAAADPTFQAVGSVTSVGLTQPAAGITVSGSPVTGSGSMTLALANDLAGLEGISGTGIAVRTATDTWTQRSIQGTTNQIDVANTAGAAGNPTISIASNPIIPGTSAMTVPVGTTAQRTGSPSNGMTRYNSDLNVLESYVNGAWVSIFSGGGGIQVVSLPVLFTDIAVAATSTDIALHTIPVNCHLIAAAIDTITEGDSVATLTLSAGWFSSTDTIAAYNGLTAPPNAATTTAGNTFLPIARDLRFYATSTVSNLNTMTQGEWVVRLSYIQY